jgi:hypothetical protein
LTNFEKQIAKTTDRLAGLLTTKVVQEVLDSDNLKQQSSELIKNMPGKMENQGLREVKIKPLRGGAFTIKTAYYTKKKKKTVNKALYPGLFTLGIYDHFTPGLAEQVCLLPQSSPRFKKPVRYCKITVYILTPKQFVRLQDATRVELN